MASNSRRRLSRSAPIYGSGAQSGSPRDAQRPRCHAAAFGIAQQVTRIVRLGVSVATSGDVREQPKVADAASELLQDVFGKDKSPCRLVYGVASLPLGAPVELEVIFEVAG
ncbi:MAG TPA: RidA family protein [Bryobacteraceae bacterium]|nr:RidA family protein [Bryobacteraceae bacterium]